MIKKKKLVGYYSHFDLDQNNHSVAPFLKEGSGIVKYTRIPCEIKN